MQSAAETLVLAVFAVVYLGMALGRLPGLAIDRTGIALVGAIVLHLAGVVDGERALAAIDVPTLVLLFGLMILSSQYAACGFYDWCAARIAATPAGPATLLALTVAVAGVVSAVLANDVVVFAMTPVLCAGLLRRGLDPRPFVVALAAAANAGSAATAIGNPQNILIAQYGGLDFWRFLLFCGPPALAALVVVWAVVLLLARRAFAAAPPAAAGIEVPRPDRSGLVKALIATAVLLALFATPLPRTEGVLAVAGALLVSRRLATRTMLGLVDWHLLVLFAALFVVTDAFAATSTARAVVARLAGLDLGTDRLLLQLPVALAGSNTIGNVPLVVLVLQLLHPVGEGPLYALALLTTLAGNLLLTGSLANIIAVEQAARAGVRVGFADHARFGVPITLLSLLLAALWLLVTGALRP
ncbi:putative transporter [bacterium HR39]|nr:putative transporter [bacterium HR39]